MLLAKRRMRAGARYGGRGDDVMAVKVLATTCYQWEIVRNFEQTVKDKRCESSEPKEMDEIV